MREKTINKGVEVPITHDLFASTVIILAWVLERPSLSSYSSQPFHFPHLLPLLCVDSTSTLPKPMEMRCCSWVRAWCPLVQIDLRYNGLTIFCIVFSLYVCVYFLLLTIFVVASFFIADSTLSSLWRKEGALARGRGFYPATVWWPHWVDPSGSLFFL